MPEKVLYAMIPDDLHAWVYEISAAAGVPQRVAVAAVLRHAKDEGWTLTARPMVEVKP